MILLSSPYRVPRPSYKTRSLLRSIIKEQMMEYDIEHFEKTVRMLSNDSLKGIKIIGALLGALIGAFTLII